MADSEFFDGCDNGDGLPIRCTVPTEPVESIQQIEKMVNIEIDRSRTRSNHLNKMMRILIEQQQDVQQQTKQSYSKLSAQIDEQMALCKDATPPPHTTPPHSPIAASSDSSLQRSPTSSSDKSTPPDPSMIDTPRDPDVIDISPVASPPNPDQPGDGDDPEVKIVPGTVAEALKARGIPEDLKVIFEFHPVHGPRLLVTRETRLEEKAEQRVQENMSKLAAGFAAAMGWPNPLPYTETFTEVSNGACYYL